MSPAALFADGEGDLITSALLAGTSQDFAGHEQQRGVVVQLVVRTATELCNGLAKQCQRFGGNLKAQHMFAHLRPSRGVRIVARKLARDELFQLPDGLAASNV